MWDTKRRTERGEALDRKLLLGRSGRDRGAREKGEEEFTFCGFDDDAAKLLSWGLWLQAPQDA